MFEQAHQKMISRTKMAGEIRDELILPFRNELTFRLALIRYMKNVRLIKTE